MHPILTNPRYLLMYLAAWVPLGLMVGSMLSLSAHLPWRETTWITAPFIGLLAFLCLVPLYMCRALPVGGTSVPKLIINHLLAALAILAVVQPFLFLDLKAGSEVFHDFDRRSLPGLPLLTVSTLLLYLLAVGGHYAGLASESTRRAQVLARDAELRALKAQVNPHFLFNSLNLISALTSIDASRARDMCVKLSEFLRLSLRLGERSSIPFNEEMEVARTYLSVEQVRFGRRLRVLENIAAACGACDVPPLLIQPLVENAIKHGIANLVDGGEIAITGTCDGGTLHFSIQNEFDPDAPVGKRSGIGLRNVRDRLTARYGAAAQLKVDIEENQYRVTITAPCEKGRIPA